MIHLLEMSISNFMCFGEEVHVKLKDIGLVNLLGSHEGVSSVNSNGAGKSSVIEAIYYAFYGKTIRGVRLDKVIRRGVDTGCNVRVLFEDERGNLYSAQRHRGCKTNKNALLLRQILPSEEELVIEGKDQKETQQYLESLVGMSSTLFNQIILFGKGGMSRFSTLGDSEKKKLIEEVLDVSVYERSAELTRKKIREIKRDREELQQDLSAMKEHLGTATCRVQDLQLMKKEWCDRRSEESKKLEGEINQLERMVEEGKGIEKEDPTLYEIQLREYDSKITEAQAEIDRLATESKRVREKSQKRHRELTLEENEYRVSCSSLQKEHRRIDELIFEGRCPTCGQETDRSLFKGVEEISKEILEQKTIIRKIQEEIDLLEQATNKITTEYTEKEQEIRFQLVGYQKKQREIHSEIHTLRNTPDPEDMLLMARRRYEELLADVDFPHEQSLKEAEDKRDEIKDKENVLSQRIDDMSIGLSKYRVLNEVFSSIRSFVFESLLGELNKKVREYCNIFTGGQLVAVIKSTSYTAKGQVVEKVSVDVINHAGGDDYVSCSSGERERIDFPIALALQDIAARRGLGVGVCFFDELFEGVDEAGSRNMIELLQVASRREHTNSIFVITHNDSLKSFFPTSWRVVKQGGVAHIDHSS